MQRQGIPSGAAGDVALAIAEGILKGQTATRLAPTANATRAEAAAMMASCSRSEVARQAQASPASL